MGSLLDSTGYYISCKGHRFLWVHHGAEVPGLHGASRLVRGVALRSSLGKTRWSFAPFI
jgi:hypothetical protein